MTLADFTQLLIQDTIRSADLPVNPDDAPRDKRLAEAALMARRCGVLPTLEDLGNEVMRRAWVAAGEAYDVEQASRIGLASQGIEGMACVASVIDGGQALRDVLVNKVAARVAAERSG